MQITKVENGDNPYYDMLIPNDMPDGLGGTITQWRKKRVSCEQYHRELLRKKEYAEKQIAVADEEKAIVETLLEKPIEEAIAEEEQRKIQKEEEYQASLTATEEIINNQTKKTNE